MNELLEFLKEKGFLAEGADETAITAKVDGVVGGKVKEQTTGLIKNRDDLKEEKLKLKQEFDAYKNQMSFVADNDLSAESFADLKNQLETFRAQGDSDDDLKEKLEANYERGKKAKEDELSPQLKKINDLLETTIKERDQAVNSFRSYQAEAEIRKAVAQTGVKASPLWFQGLMASAKIDVSDNGKMDIQLPYEGEHLPKEDWVKAFPATEEAKRMMPVIVNSGGDGFGGAGAGSSDSQSMADVYNGMFNQ